jgi:hypothetical protein
LAISFLADREPRDPTKLVVSRRSDHAALVTFDYDRRLPVVNHRDELVERFGSQHIFDVCRELGIDIGQVGAPTDD